jgi:hypothetical protein
MGRRPGDGMNLPIATGALTERALLVSRQQAPCGVPSKPTLSPASIHPMFWLGAYESGDRFYFALSEYESDIYVMDLKY